MAKQKQQRKLTEKEKQRVKMINGIAADLAKKGYSREDVTVPMSEANKIAYILIIPIALIFGIWYVIVNGFHFRMSLTEDILFLVLMIVLIVVHELIHGLTWGIFAPHHFKSIEFGIMQDSHTPYCTCLEPLNKWAYIAGSFMPCLVLGIIPAVVSIYTASSMWLFIGAFMTMAAAGDLINIKNMLRYKTAAGDVIMDHPSECGFIVFKK